MFAPINPPAQPRRHAFESTTAAASRRLRFAPGVTRATTKSLRLTLGQFPLEVALRGTDAALPCVMVDSAAPDARVLFANAPAARLGACPGMPVKVLGVFGPQVRPVARHPAAEALCREHLVRWLRALGGTVHDGQSGTGALILHALFVTGRPEDVWLARLRRDLRAFGFRARLELTDAPPELDWRGQRDSSDDLPTGFSSHLDLPWPASGPRELHPAITRLLEELRVIHEAEQRPVRGIQWTFQDTAGAHHHHAFDVEAALQPLPAAFGLRQVLRARPPNRSG